MCHLLYTELFQNLVEVQLEGMDYFSKNMSLVFYARQFS